MIVVESTSVNSSGMEIQEARNKKIEHSHASYKEFAISQLEKEVESSWN